MTHLEVLLAEGEDPRAHVGGEHAARALAGEEGAEEARASAQLEDHRAADERCGGGEGGRAVAGRESVLDAFAVGLPNGGAQEGKHLRRSLRRCSLRAAAPPARPARASAGRNHSRNGVRAQLTRPGRHAERREGQLRLETNVLELRHDSVADAETEGCVGAARAGVRRGPRRGGAVKSPGGEDKNRLPHQPTRPRAPASVAGRGPLSLRLPARLALREGPRARAAMRGNFTSSPVRKEGEHGTRCPPGGALSPVATTENTVTADVALGAQPRWTSERTPASLFTSRCSPSLV